MFCVKEMGVKIILFTVSVLSISCATGYMLMPAKLQGQDDKERSFLSISPFCFFGCQSSIMGTGGVDAPNATTLTHNPTSSTAQTMTTGSKTVTKGE